MADQSIDISGLSKAEVMAALYNASSPVGRGFLQAGASPEEMTVAEAERHLLGGTLFGYVNGRSFKVDLDTDSFDPWLYDRDNGGEGTAETIIERLRDTGSVVSDAARDHRDDMTAQHAYESPENAELGEAIEEVAAEADRLWAEVVADGIEDPREGMTPKEHLDWSSDQALVYIDHGAPEKAIMLFLSLVSANRNTAWIATHEMTPMLLQTGARGGRHEMERMMKGFAA